MGLVENALEQDVGARGFNAPLYAVTDTFWWGLSVQDPHLVIRTAPRRWADQWARYD